MQLRMRKIGVWPFESFYFVGDIGAGGMFSILQFKISHKAFKRTDPEFYSTEPKLYFYYIRFDFCLFIYFFFFQSN